MWGSMVALRAAAGAVATMLMVGNVHAEQPTCFSRAYDGAHLAKNPHQTVTSIGFALKPQSRDYQVWLTRRGSSTLNYNAGRCDVGIVNGRQGLYCHAEIECDGDCGSFGIVFEKENSILMHFRGVSDGGFRLHSVDGTSMLTPELDDGVFRLSAVSQGSCGFNPEYAAQVRPRLDEEALTQVALADGFKTPSSNIFCRLSGSAAEDGSLLQCEIREIDGPWPKAPSWCEFDWGQSFEVGSNAEPGRRTCHSDTIWSEGFQTLPYGSVWGQGGFTCRSSEAGLQCQNRHGKGFFLSRSKQLLQ